MELYYSCIRDAIEVLKTGIQFRDYKEFQKQYAACFKKVPDDSTEQFKEGLIYVDYFINEKGQLDHKPARYNHFLPISAAGIFGSNDSKAKKRTHSVKPQDFKVSDLEKILGAKVLDMYELSEARQAETLKQAEEKLDAQ
jgi:uncharacterized glyoxalase superfamily metalloenzyme YdcJ